MFLCDVYGVFYASFFVFRDDVLRVYSSTRGSVYGIYALGGHYKARRLVGFGHYFYLDCYVCVGDTLDGIVFVCDFRW